MEPDDIDTRAPEWNAVDSLLGAHLHQDLYQIHGGPWNAVRDFYTVASRQERRNAALGLRRLLTEFGDEPRLAAAAKRLGMDYVPTHDGYGTYRVWLTAVADFIEDPERAGAEPTRDAPLPWWRSTSGGQSPGAN